MKRLGEGEPIRVTHVISGLELGGAEMMLYKLLSSIDRARFEPEVISLSSFGPLTSRIAALGIPVSALGMSRGRVQLRPLGRLARRVAGERTHVVHTWMYHADLLGGALARALGDARVLWGVRGSLDPRLSKRSAQLVARACAATSHRVPDRIVSCSQRLLEMHADLGYARERMLVIPNGFDLSWFRPEPARRVAMRACLGVGERELLVGVIGRFHPQKDHRSFVEAAGVVASARPDARFLLCGPGVDGENRELMGWISAAGIADRCVLTGALEDPRGALNALDLLVCSSSFGEGFPNVLGEAMACGVPCVTTDVGDAAAIVADTGRVVGVSDPDALAHEILALLELSSEERARLAGAARSRVEEQFELASVTRRFEELYLEVCLQAL
ncbi:MAG TPA: glycosyltransferase [Solirubrobacteraceae bacterium]|nr:glycosyltransferase [Solirubrobacteraceae bacterium]